MLLCTAVDLGLHIVTSTLKVLNSPYGLGRD